MAWFNLVSDFTQHTIEKVFYHFGLKVFQRPKSFIFAGLILTILCSIGFINFDYQNTVIDLWIPQNSDIYVNYQRTIKLFGDYDSDMTLLISHKQGKNLLTPDNLNIIYSLSEFVR